MHRFGSAANLNIHLHCLALGGVYSCHANGAPAVTAAGRGHHLSHRLRASRRPEAADLPGCDASRARSATAPVRRHRRFQPARCSAGRGERPQAAVATVPSPLLPRAARRPASAAKRPRDHGGPVRWRALGVPVRTRPQPAHLKPGDVLRLGIRGPGEQRSRVHAWDPLLTDGGVPRGCGGHVVRSLTARVPHGSLRGIEANARKEAT